METNADGNEVQKVKVVATGGNDLLGGKDWDDKLYDFIVQAACDDNGLTPDDLDAESRQTIRSKIELTKKKLSNTETAKVRVPINGLTTTVEITREEFESMTSDKVAQTMNYVEDTLKKAGNIEIDTVLLVGGSTYMPMIRNAVEARFPGKVQLEDPDRAVAKGAAIYASMLVDEEEEDDGGTTQGGKSNQGGGSGQGGVPSKPKKKNGSGIGTKVDVDDQTPRSFGPGVLNKDMEYIIDNIIKIGEHQPALAVKTYYTVADNMEKIVLRAFENMSLEDNVTPCVDDEGEEQACNPADAVKLLGELEMVLPPQTRKGTPIEVTFQVDSAGVYVKAVNMQTGEAMDTTLRMESDIDLASSNVHNLGVSGE